MTTSKHILLVLTNPVEGREEEYNDWYSHRHLDDLLKIPGIVAAQRFGLSPVQRMPAPIPWQYFALYEIETDDLEATVQAIVDRSGTDMMPISDAMQADRMSFVLQTITDRKTSDG